MKWLKVTVDADPQAEDIVSNVLIEAGATGVSIEGAEPELASEAGGDWDYAGGIKASGPYGVTAYYPMDGRESATYADIQARLRDIHQKDQEGLYGTLTTSTEIVNDQDWISSWKAYFKPVRASDYIVVKPSWIQYKPDPEEIVLEIDPGLAFGTGSHETTRLCLRLMEQFLYRGDVVVDVGTGSGVLALAAARLGAERVYALDSDPVAVEVAAANAEKNGVQDKIETIESDLLDDMPFGIQADMVVCNIIADVIIRLIPRLGGILKPNGMLVFSGVIDTRFKDVQEALARNYYRIIRVVSEGEWRGIACKNKV